MCVSAEASFVLTGVLVPVGIYCVKIAVQRDHSAIPIAAIPLLFGIQHFSEGLVWVGIGRDDAVLTNSAATCYLFFALAFWLFWVPFSAMFLEPRKKFKMVFGIAAVLGLVGGMGLFIPVLADPEALRVTVLHHSIDYDYATPPVLMLAPIIVWQSCYVAIIILPLIFLKEKTLTGFSTALVVSSVISHHYFWYAFASIWCFIAAILSLYFGYLFHRWPRREVR